MTTKRVKKGREFLVDPGYFEKLGRCSNSQQWSQSQSF